MAGYGNLGLGEIPGCVHLECGLIFFFIDYRSRVGGIGLLSLLRVVMTGGGIKT